MQTRGSGSLTGSDHGLLGHVMTYRRVRLEQKISLQEKSHYTTLAEFHAAKASGSLSHQKWIRQWVETWGLALRSGVLYHGGELGSLTRNWWTGQNDSLLCVCVWGAGCLVHWGMFSSVSVLYPLNEGYIIKSNQHKWIFTRIKWVLCKGLKICTLGFTIR